MNTTSRFALVVLGPFLVSGMVGCGGADLAPASGTITYKGYPVTGGSLIFSPIGGDTTGNPGKPGWAEVKDGAFVIKTDGAEGAVLGRHRITFTPPPQVLTEEQRHDRRYKAPPPLYMGLVPRVSEVTIKSDGAKIHIELVPKGRGELVRSH